MTLIEVMVALGVLIILVGGLFFVVQTSLKTVLSINDSSSREAEIANLADILRTGFRNLPAQSRLVALPMKDGGTEQLLVIVRNAPGFLTWLSEPEPDNTIVLLALRNDDKGHDWSQNAPWRMCLKRFAPPKNFSDQEFSPQAILKAGADVPWLELVGNFHKTHARFFDATSQTWKDRWDNPKARPGLIEMTLRTERKRDAGSETSIFWVPPVQGDPT
jgi:type II secretory pathway pseudopilin PulG